MYKLTDEEREEVSKDATEFMSDEKIGMTAQHMANRFIKDMDNAFDNWKPKTNFRLEQVV